MPLARGGGEGERAEKWWQGYHHQMQREQQAVGAMEGDGSDGPVEFWGAEMQYHHHHAQYQQHHHYYHRHQQLEEQQQQSKYCLE